MSFTLFLSFLLALPLAVLAADKPATCYSPNGAATTVTGGSLQIPLHACPPGPDGISTCCAEGDTCSPDRLCYNPGGNNVWRNFCTDPTWKSGSCSPLCRGTDEWNAGPVQITPCQDGMMCCGGNNTQCCSAHQGSYAFTGVPINATMSGESSSSGSGLTSGEIAGIVVGGIAILLLTAVLILLVLRFKTDRQNKHKRQDSPDLRAHIVSPTSATHYGAPSLHSHPSVKSSHALQQYPMDKPYHQHHPPVPPPPQTYYSPVEHKPERPLPALPRTPAQIHELGGGEGVSRFEVSGQSVWDNDKKY